MPAALARSRKRRERSTDRFARKARRFGLTADELRRGLVNLMRSALVGPGGRGPHGRWSKS